jgi:hypothetical protein
LPRRSRKLFRLGLPYSAARSSKPLMDKLFYAWSLFIT